MNKIAQIIKDGEAERKIWLKIVDKVSNAEGIVDLAKGEIIFKSFIRFKQRALLRAVREKVDRLKLEVDATICDCGEPFKETDLANLIYEFNDFLKEAEEEVGK